MTDDERSILLALAPFFSQTTTTTAITTTTTKQNTISPSPASRSSSRSKHTTNNWSAGLTTHETNEYLHTIMSSPPPSSSSTSTSSSSWTVSVAVVAVSAAAAATAFVAGYAAASASAAMQYHYYTGSSQQQTEDDDEDSTSTKLSKSQQLLLLLQQKQSRQQQQQQQQQKQKQNQTDQNKSFQQSQSLELPEELRVEQLSRHELFFGGQENMSTIRSAKVCVVGLGGVGSHTAVMLARGGVATASRQGSGHRGGLLRLIDFDQVSLSSLNRHACATLEDVGVSKSMCLSRYLTEKLGLPTSQVQPRQEMFTEDSAERLLRLSDNDTNSNSNCNYDWDVVIDCIDDVPTKACLLEFCLSHKIKVVSCMGAGGKSDFTRLHYSDLRTASRDPLASKLRQTLKKKLKLKLKAKKKNQNENENNNENNTNDNDDDDWLDDMDKLSIVYSSEQPVVKLADLTEEQQQLTAATSGDPKKEFGQVDGMRIRVLPVLGPIPAIMGQALATATLCHLAKQPIQNPQTGERVGKNVRNRLFQKLLDRELKISSGKIQVQLDDEDCCSNEDNNNNNSSDNNNLLYKGRLEIDGDDVEYLYGIWRNRCAVTGARIGTTLFLARWNLSKPATTDNLILISQPALVEMDTKGKVASIPMKTRQIINQRLQSCRDMNE